MPRKFWVPGLAILGAAAAGLGVAAPAQAAEAGGSLLNDRFMISLGGFLLSTKTEIALNGSANSTGTVIDFKRDLGLKDADRWRLDATWRFKERHKLRAMYFDTSNSGSRSLERTITIRDTVYPVNAAITAETSIKVTELAYEYAFHKTETYEISGTAGIHSIKFNFALSGNATVGGRTGQAQTETADTTAPLPVIGIRGLWQLAPNWYIDGVAQFFALKFDKYDGRLSDLRFNVTRMFGKRFGVGAGYNDFVTKLDVDSKRFDGSLRWRYGGAQLFFVASF